MTQSSSSAYSRASSCHRHLVHRFHARCLAFFALPPLLIVVGLLFYSGQWDWPGELFTSGGSSSSGSPFSLSSSPERSHKSPFSFNLPAAAHADWMAHAPDEWPLGRLALPGTHDTMTHRIEHLGYRCQNSGLGTQLQAGVRYFDIRARVQIQDWKGAERSSERSEERKERGEIERSEERKRSEEKKKRGETQRKVLGIYHANAYTGYDLGAVLETIFGFLEAHPTEAVVVRLKEENRPVNGSVDDAPGPKTFDDSIEAVVDADGLTSFEAALKYYRETDARTVRGFAERVYGGGDGDGGSGSGGIPLSAAPSAVPTVKECRGKVVFLQEFPYFPEGQSFLKNESVAGPPGGYYGIPWALESALLQVEDDWVMEDLTTLARKWTSIRTNLQEAAKASASLPIDRRQKLFLSHLSASVGVLPIDAAAGPLNGSVAGMNDQTGRWLVAGHDDDERAGAAAGPKKDKNYDTTPVGIVIADFPGRRLVDAILQRNNFTRGLW